MHIHILGICGTFMGGLAALAREAGHRVTGCDAGVYPPMSDQLRALGIELIEGFGAEQLAMKPDVWVVGNVVSRARAADGTPKFPLMEAILDSGARYTSGPQWLAENVLHGRHVLAVAGTHGKTTTTSMLVWVLECAGLQPGFLVGGVPLNFGVSARAPTLADSRTALPPEGERFALGRPGAETGARMIGANSCFVIEADEYDTAFFDKRSKFVHYRPRTAILNNLEFDHADIFDDLAAIEKQFHQQWKNDDEEGGKNLHEEDFLRTHLKRIKREDIKLSYTKVLNYQAGQELVNNMHNLMGNDLNVIVYNFVDMMSHARTELEVLKELAGDEISYRSVTKSWFEHSPLHQALKKVADKKINLILATDHGSVRVKSAVKVIGDKQTTTNLRYKHGRNLNYEPKDVLAFRDPKEAGLPVPTVNSSYIFAKEDLFLCYPNNYNYYVSYYKNTFQHGGVSLEEMVIPVIRMTSR